MSRSGRRGDGSRWARWAVGGVGAVVLVAAAVPARPRRHVVEIRGMAFQPAELSVERGDTVVWINRDIVPHTATAKDVRGPAWDTGVLPTDSSGRYVAAVSGVAAFGCSLHPTMRGKLIVR